VAPSLPDFADLPVREGLPPGSSWGVWGDDDRLGCLNLLGEERTRAGLSAVVDARVFSLNLELDLPDPPLFGRPAFRHDVSWLAGGAGHDDSLSDWNTQSSSQWDGFRHIRHPLYGFYGGVYDERHGVDVWAARGIVGRAVLCDVGRWREAEGRPIDYAEADPIEPDDVRGALAAGGTQVETGDILLLRTGWLRWYRSLDAAGRTALRTGHRAPGLRPGTATAAMLWDLHIAALAADNPAVEVWPPGATLAPDKRDAVRADPERCHEAFVHFSLLALLGLPLGELFDLDALADAVAADGRSACLLTSAPLRLRHGVASPANALAIR